MRYEPGRDDVALAADELRPGLTILVYGSVAIAAISAATLPWPWTVASTALGALMIAGADIDARTYLLPDAITWGAMLLGTVVALVLAPIDPWRGLAAAVARAAGTGLILGLLRWGYAGLKGREGLGLGDVKLAAAAGAWLPVDVIPVCFGLATGGALLTVLLAGCSGREISPTARLPFGAFLCPALRLVFYCSVLSG